MLILTRKPGEAVNVYGKDGSLIASICVTSNKGKKIRLGFMAHEANVKFLRGELNVEKADIEEDLESPTDL